MTTALRRLPMPTGPSVSSSPLIAFAAHRGASVGSVRTRKTSSTGRAMTTLMIAFATGSTSQVVMIRPAARAASDRQCSEFEVADRDGCHDHRCAKHASTSWPAASSNAAIGRQRIMNLARLRGSAGRDPGRLERVDERVAQLGGDRAVVDQHQRAVTPGHVTPGMSTSTAIGGTRFSTTSVVTMTCSCWRPSSLVSHEGQTSVERRSPAVEGRPAPCAAPR